ncbi:MAG: hypothetical protein AAFO73_11235, partial [Pseudomonadota bacterium]
HGFSVSPVFRAVRDDSPVIRQAAGPNIRCDGAHGTQAPRQLRGQSETSLEKCKGVKLIFMSTNLAWESCQHSMDKSALLLSILEQKPAGNGRNSEL